MGSLHTGLWGIEARTLQNGNIFETNLNFLQFFSTHEPKHGFYLE